MKKPLSFARILLPSFIILEIVELLFMYFAVPSFLFHSEYRVYVLLFFLWSGMIGSPIVAMLIYGSLKSRNQSKEQLPKV